GRDYAASEFNRATDAHRQPGSAFKPFVYLAALEAGLDPSTVREDRPVRFGNWAPENYSGRYRGRVTLADALAMSINTVAAELAVEVGPGTVVDAARRLGIESDLNREASIALGTSEVTPLELTAAYVPFANGGYAILPHVIERVRTAEGEILYSLGGSGLGTVVAARELGMMNAMLTRTLDIGTGRRAALEGRPAAGKTGTTQENRDAWFVGYTANLTAGVWIGRDDNRPMEGVTGGTGPTLIWRDFMLAAHNGVPVATLPGVGAASVEEIVGGGPAASGPPADLGPAGASTSARDEGLPDGGGSGRNPIGDFLSSIFGN
ncbi:MAG: penicillin-binding protein, partial [Hyphomicrobiaceae bacterium]|nr:penicillin-binding protein [Hyphomicrobiaceae bacterium]